MSEEEKAAGAEPILDAGTSADSLPAHVSDNGHHPQETAEMDYEALLEGNFHRADELQAEAARAEAEAALLTEGAHDEGNAWCVNLRYAGHFLSNKSFGWMQWTGTHWTQEGAEAALDRAVVDTLSARIEAALRSGEADKHSDLIKKSIPSSNRVHGAKYLFNSIVYTAPGKFDTNPDWLNCPNGVVDLCSGELRPHSPAQLLTHCTTVEYQPDANQEPWTRWLSEAVGVESAGWLQLAVGYSLTGHTREEILFYLYGPPRSGKGTFTESLLALLGSPLAEVINFATLTAPREADTQNFNLAPLHSARLIVASESNQYERFNEAKVKQLTGGDKIQAAFKHRTPFSYRPQYKIWLASNQPVNADPDDDAVWGRVRLIHFATSHLGSEDKILKQRMRSPEVLEGILAWAVRGAMAWYALGAAGLPEMESSVRLKGAQRSDLDNVGAWLQENCTNDAEAFTANTKLYPNYEAWCTENGVRAKSHKGLTQALVRKGYARSSQRVNSKVVRGFRGLSVDS